MSDEPKLASGEWTPEKVQGLFSHHGWEGISRAVSAAIAAERGNAEKAAVRAELAQIKLAAAVEALKKIALSRGDDGYEKTWQGITADAAIAKIGCKHEHYPEDRITQLEQQLAAEREKVRKLISG